MSEETNRSTFVTVVAWIFIVLSGFMTVMAILQNIMFHTMFSSVEFRHAMEAQPPSGAPPFATFMISHFQLFLVAMLVVSVTTFVSSIGLLKRQNWARFFFVGLMVLGIVWNLSGLFMQLSMFSSMRAQFAAAPGAPDMGPALIAIAVVSALFALAFCGLFGWIAKRLLSREVATEFGR